MYILKYIRDGWNDLVFPFPSISIFIYVKCHRCTMYTSVFTVKLHKYKIFSSVSVVVKFLNTLNTHYRIVSFYRLFKVSTFDSQFPQPPKDLSQRLGRESPILN